jgi:hypothetical protein
MKYFVLTLLFAQSLFAAQEIQVVDGVILKCDESKVLKINMSSPHQAKIDCVNIGLATGESCLQDSECTSKCCSSVNGLCSPHNPQANVFCQKSPGQTCYSDEYCRKEKLPTCLIVKTGLDSQGKVTCTRRCYNLPFHGECRQGICLPPKSRDVPPFDPSNPDCSVAVEPPVLN